jgi:CDP-glucose 4,6-dehydratase
MSLSRKIRSFYNGRKVFVTGHNGFKGSWMCKVLVDAGADVCGFSLPCEKDSPFLSMGLDAVSSVEGDVGNTEELSDAVMSFAPEVVIHMAAQPLVLRSYDDPVFTYRTNVMGTVNILEAVRRCDPVISAVNVTTDKVYRNVEKNEGYREDEVLDGHDPYSNSKSCSELVTAAYKRSFPEYKRVPLSTCRAGNVIGGGDRAKDRVIPDCVRSAERNESMIIRNPNSVRPYQHVLEPVCAYLLLAAEQAADPKVAGCYNIGPEEESTVTTRQLVQLFCDNWSGASWVTEDRIGRPHEAGILRLNCDKFRNTFGWAPKWNIEDAVKRTVEWYVAENKGGDTAALTTKQIEDYLNEKR